MKKFLCLLAVLPVLFTGCGHSRVILDGAGGEYYVNQDEDKLSEKVRPTEDPAETKPPKKRPDNYSADGENSGETATQAADGETESSGETAPDEAQTPENSGDQPDDEENYKYHLDGFVLKAEGDELLICEEDLCRISLKCGSGVLDDIQIGDEVKIKYDGILSEGSPQTGTAYSVEVTQKASKKYQLKRFAYRDLYFTILVPEDWSDRVIDYPQEGDFTDWGIRLQPNGANGSIDISWHSAFAIFEPYDKRKITINNNKVTEYSKSGKWKFLEFTSKNYIISNNFEQSEQTKYDDDIRRIRETMEFV